MSRMFLAEALLFFNRRPCFYKLYADGETILGEPEPHPYYSSTPFPAFSAQKQNGTWQIDGIEDAHLLQQINGELEKADRWQAALQQQA